MGIIEIFLTGIGLSMDALAVSICKGLAMKKVKIKNSLLIAFFFGIFQAAMPLIGWFLGVRFRVYIEAVDHWVAFVLLVFIGGKMIFDAISEKKDKKDDKDASNKNKDPDALDIKELTVLAIATSIDALAVGIAFACLGDSINIIPAISIIGATTFAICFCGVYIGNKFGNKFENNAAFAGGTILILIGLKILFEHIGVLSAIFG